MRTPTTDAAALAARVEGERARVAAKARATAGTWTLDDMRLLSGPTPAPTNRDERRRYAALSRRSHTR